MPLFSMICVTCKQDKVTKEFGWRNKAKRIRNPRCKACQRDYAKAHYTANKAYYAERNRARQQEMQDYVRGLKENTPCADCNNCYPHYVMDFQHLRDKSTGVSKLVRTSTLKRVKEEIDKCVLVCSNCHRIRTHKRGR
jgi:hypothetical protein